MLIFLLKYNQNTWLETICMILLSILWIKVLYLLKFFIYLNYYTPYNKYLKSLKYDICLLDVKLLSVLKYLFLYKRSFIFEDILYICLVFYYYLTTDFHGKVN